MFLKIYFIFAFISFSSATDQNEPISNQLYKDLMKDYERAVLPQYNSSKSVEVKFGLALQQILDVDTHNSKFSANVWVNYEWKDPRFNFTGSEAYKNGVHSIRIKEEDLWMPDIMCYNSLANSRVYDHTVVVYYDGTMSFVPIEEIITSCPYDLTWFPYDTQLCTMKFGSWTYDGLKLNVTAMRDTVDISTYMPHDGWDLLSATAKRSVQRYSCCPEPYVDITFSFSMRRRGSTHTWRYVTPAVILTFLIPVLFLLPSENSSRFALGSGMLISTLLLMMMLGEELPRTLISRPVLGYYYDMMFILVSLALAVSAMVHNLACKYNGLSSPPQLIRTVFLNVLGKLVCVRYDKKYGVPAGNEEDPEENIVTDNQSSVTKTAAYEWRLVGKVLDRIFLFFFFVVICIGSIAVLPKS